MAQNNNSNFSFLSEHWGFLLEDAQQVEGYALRDRRAAAIYARRALEIALKWLFANDTALKHPYEKSLAAMIHEPTFARNIKKGLFHDIKFIHRLVTRFPRSVVAASLILAAVAGIYGTAEMEMMFRKLSPDDMSADSNPMTANPMSTPSLWRSIKI